MTKNTSNSISAGAGANASGTASIAANAASAHITIKRQSRVYRNGNNGGCVMRVDKDIMELLRLKTGDVLMVTANADGWFRAEKADTV